MKYMQIMKKKAEKTAKCSIYQKTEATDLLEERRRERNEEKKWQKKPHIYYTRVSLPS